MDTATAATRSCTPQLLLGDGPAGEWTLEQLQDYARSLHQAIVSEETSLSLKYWRLGTALNLLRKNFNHGQWQQLLVKLGIDKTRASRARAIARTFASKAELAGLTVQEAYERRRRKRVTTSANGNESVCKLQRLLDRVAKITKGLTDLEDIEEPEALLPTLDASIGNLERLRDMLRRRSQDAVV